MTVRQQGWQWEPPFHDTSYRPRLWFVAFTEEAAVMAVAMIMIMAAMVKVVATVPIYLMAG